MKSIFLMFFNVLKDLRKRLFSEIIDIVPSFREFDLNENLDICSFVLNMILYKKGTRINDGASPSSLNVSFIYKYKCYIYNLSYSYIIMIIYIILYSYRG